MSRMRRKRAQLGRQGVIMRKAWERTKRQSGKIDHKKFSLNLVGAQIHAGVSNQRRIKLPWGYLGRCTNPTHTHIYGERDSVFVYGGKYLCPRCGYPIKRAGT